MEDFFIRHSVEKRNPGELYFLNITYTLRVVHLPRFHIFFISLRSIQNSGMTGVVLFFQENPRTDSAHEECYTDLCGCDNSCEFERSDCHPF